MGSKRPHERPTLTDADAMTRLRRWRAAWDSTLEMAEALSVSHSIVSLTLRGKRPLGGKLAKAIGLRREVVYIVVGLKSFPTARPKRRK